MNAIARMCPLILVLSAAAPFDSPAGASANGAEAIVRETPTIVAVENESVKLIFAAAANYVPTDLAYKRGSGFNLRETGWAVGVRQLCRKGAGGADIRWSPVGNGSLYLHWDC